MENRLIIQLIFGWLIAAFLAEVVSGTIELVAASVVGYYVFNFMRDIGEPLINTIFQGPSYFVPKILKFNTPFPGASLVGDTEIGWAVTLLTAIGQIIGNALGISAIIALSVITQILSSTVKAFTLIFGFVDILQTLGLIAGRTDDITNGVELTRRKRDSLLTSLQLLDDVHLGMRNSSFVSCAAFVLCATEDHDKIYKDLNKKLLKEFGMPEKSEPKKKDSDAKLRALQCQKHFPKCHIAKKTLKETRNALRTFAGFAKVER